MGIGFHDGAQAAARRTQHQLDAGVTTVGKDMAQAGERDTHARPQCVTPNRPQRGTTPALRIFVTPMATSSAGLLGKLPDLIAEQKTGEGRPFGEVLPLLDAGDGGCQEILPTSHLSSSRKRGPRARD